MFAFFERLIPAFPPDEPTQPPGTLFAFCRHYTRGAEKYLLLMSVLTAMIAVLEATLFAALGQLVDWLINRNPETLLQEEGPKLFLFGFLLLVVMPVLLLLHSTVIHQTLLGNYPMAIRWNAHRYLLRQSMSFYQDDFAGRIATKVMQTSLAIRETVMKLLDVMVYVTVYFISMTVVIAQADLILALPLVIWLAVYIGLQAYFLPRLRRVSTEQAEARSMMTGRLVDSYTNIATVKLFSHTRRESEYARESMGSFLDTVHRQMRLATGISVSIQASNYVLAFAISALSIALWMSATVTVGAIAVAISLVLRLNGMSQWIMWEVSALFENIGTATDGMETLAVPQTVQDSPNASTLRVREGSISFDKVSFHYGKASGVIDGFELEIKAGEKVGLVGRSGAGKSTLVNLLMRFYDIQSGSIRIDGQDIRSVTQESLRAHIGMVTQDTSLLHRSIRDNLMYGRPNATEAEMIDAAKKAEAHDFICELNDSEGRTGYDAVVGERGVKLSGGQRQRIAIARVLLKDAPILILDEATSALDSEIEAAIQSSLSTLMTNKTVIAIAHRLSTIAAMDRLVVIDSGRIVEMGPHEELIRTGGIYAQLWAHQTGGFIGCATEPEVADDSEGAYGT
ncbi:MAG: multidrug ABC transporter ATP-binding protein [unclassified Hahellaceae]|nr:multidrug ABC transporter ATP-binding protein [Hahellaceae bacterium]|tara:strand:+ start:30630 stop:32504 length:1875 start_codon:yes stop_codon:yes gene_type:complete